jgi:4-amino-4-deoxy-L-arabinose transferase-like glycosyltransferase
MEAPERLPYWLRQSERFLRVIVQMYIGLLVCCAPWTPWWDANPLFSSPPWLHGFIAYGAVRGVVSGLGLLNLWIALRDALRGPADPIQK